MLVLMAVSLSIQKEGEDEAAKEAVETAAVEEAEEDAGDVAPGQ